MAALITIAIVVTVAGVAFGTYVKICFSILQEDRRKWSLRGAAPNSSAQSARDLTGISSSRWD